MKYISGIFVLTLVLVTSMPAARAVVEMQFTCGEGYILADHKDVEGIDAKQCQKLWCRDLETGKMMGSGDRPNNGYRDTGVPVELCDAERNCIMCFGERRWCSGVEAGAWNPEYGAYTRGGGDTATYQSYQKAGCFTWRLEKPECSDGTVAILQDGEWVCAVSKTTVDDTRKSAIRRTGTVIRRMIR